MALPVHELFKDRDVWEFWRETGVFSEAIPRICDHIETLILRYGALYGLVVWLGTDGKLYIVASANLGLGFTYIPLRLLTQSLRPYVDEIPGHRRHWIRVDKLKNIYGRGSQDKAGNSKGYHNKKAAFSLLQKRLAESQDLPVLALVYANDKYLTLCHPQKDTAMEMLMEKVIRYYQSLSDDGCMSQIRPNISFLPPSVHVDSSRRPRRTSNVLSRPSRRKRTSKTGENQSPVDEWEAVEFMHEPGSLPWYCHAIKDPNGTGVAALIKTDNYYKWAFADARCHGPGGQYGVHHNLLVEVESELDPMGHLRCSCAVFRNCLEPKECVHTLYTRVNSERLRSMAFSKEGEVVTIVKNNSSTAGYYVDGCFVRMQGDRGLRCDSDKAFGCRHVARVREALHLDVDPEEEESESTPDPSCSSSDDEADVLPTNAWISDTSKTFKIEYPYSDALKQAVMERLLFGFSRDKEGTPLGPLQPPMPASTTCDCGLPYTRRGFKETDPVTVYMRPPHCARSLPCMVLKCQRGAPECTLHYTGLEDGLWRASKTVAVELDLLVRCARDFVGFRGHSLTAQRDSISEMYDMVSDTIPTESFLVANAFRKQSVWLNGDFLRNGVCCGLPRLRFRPPYACDGQKEDSKVSEKDKASCKHAFHKPGKRTGGVFTCMCQHGVAYASFIIKNAEGRDEPFTFLTCYLKKAPRVVVYDFACALMDYCLNRAPDFFKFTLFVVDAFHWVNHVACARSFSIKLYSEMKDIASMTQNTEACEQINAAMKRFKPVLSRMGQRPFIALLRLFLTQWNISKYHKLIRYSMARPRPEQVQVHAPDQQ
eukprot:jgi/Picre1/34479/NNA_001947.t1